MRLWIAWTSMLLPLWGMACESQNKRTCEKQFAALVSYRTEAIDYAFGNVFAAMPAEIRIRFVAADDPEFARFNGGIVYDPEHHALVFPRRMLHAKTPNPLRWAAYYWPYYEGDRERREFPVIEAVDNALWSAYLQEAARTRGLTWPHQDCNSAEVGKRLPCEMLAGGIGELVKDNHERIFNSNRLDRIWPEDFAAFRRRVWRTDLEYAEVQRYGGILLVRPLINEFGIARTLAYVAQTPFLVEEGSLRVAAVRYQERARQALSASAANAGAAKQLIDLATIRHFSVVTTDDARTR